MDLAVKIAIRNLLPIMPSIFVFGMVFGFTGALGGFPLIFVSALSWIVFAGSAQMIIILLLIEGDPLLAIFITAVLLNLRHMIYSMSIRKEFKNEPFWKKIILGYLLTDEAYLMAKLTFNEVYSDSSNSVYNPGYETEVSKVKLYLIGALGLWTSWNLFTILGYLSKSILTGLEVPGNFMIAATFVGFFVELFHKKEVRKLLKLSIILTIGAAFFISNSYNFVLVMMFGIVFAMLEQMKSMKNKEEMEGSDHRISEKITANGGKP